LTAFSISANLTGGTVLFSFINGFLPQENDSIDFIVGNPASIVGGVAFEFEGVADGFEIEVASNANGSLQLTAINDAVPVIDVKPGSNRNPISLRSKGVIPVAILSNDTFDAQDVDTQSIKFGPSQASIAHNSGHAEDVDDDGDIDLLVHFRTQETGIECDDTSVTLTAQTLLGDSVLGSDKISIVKCKKIAPHNKGKNKKD